MTRPEDDPRVKMSSALSREGVRWEGEATAKHLRHQAPASRQDGEGWRRVEKRVSTTFSDVSASRVRLIEEPNRCSSPGLVTNSILFC